MPILLKNTIFESQIWRLVPDSSEKYLILEERNFESRTVSFSALDLHSLKFIWNSIVFTEKWWLGIECAFKGRLLLHGYNHVQYANHLGIKCIDISTGKELWENMSKVFYSVDEGCVYAQNKDEYMPEVLTVLDIDSGKHLGDTAFANVAFDSTENSHYPLFFTQDDDAFGKINLFLAKKWGVNAENAVEYMEMPNHIIISYYIAGTNKLLWLNRNGEEIMHTAINQNCEGVGKQTFLVCANKLIFVKDKKEICVYEL